MKKKTAIMQDMKCNYIWACQKEQPRLAWVGLILAIIADFLGNARAWFVLSVVLAVVALYCSVKGSRSSKQSVAVLGMVVSMVFLLRVVKNYNNDFNVLDKLSRKNT